MRWLTVFALLLAVACAPAQRDPPVTPSESGGGPLVVGPSEVPGAAAVPLGPLGDLDTLDPAESAENSGDSAKAKAKPALMGQHGFAHPVVPPEQTVVRVLLYHGIGSKNSRQSVKAWAFREQLEWLGAHGIEVIRLSQLLDFLDRELWLPRHAVVITIDDGESNGYSTAYPMLKARGLPFTLGIATQVIAEHRRRGALNWGQIREMVDSGLCEVASHSVTHRAMTSLPDEVARFELERSRAVLSEALEFRPEVFFYPLGDQNYRIRRLTKLSGYRAAFVAHGGPTLLHTRRFGIPRYDVKPETSLRTFRSFFNHGIPVLRSTP